MTFTTWPWWSAGLAMDIVGILLIIQDRIGLSRAERLGEGLWRLADDLAFRFWDPGDAVETLQDAYWKRRKSFFFVAGSAMFFVPAFASVLYVRLWPVRLYLKGLVWAWAALGAVFLGLMAAAGLIWVCTLRRQAYPTSIDHLFGVAFYTFNRGLLLSLPGVILFIAAPVAVNALIVSTLLRGLSAISLSLVCFPLRLSRWTHQRYALRLPLIPLGLLLLLAGCTVQIVTTF